MFIAYSIFMFVAVLIHFEVSKIIFVTYLGKDKCETDSDCPEPYNTCTIIKEGHGICGIIVVD